MPEFGVWIDEDPQALVRFSARSGFAAAVQALQAVDDALQRTAKPAVLRFEDEASRELAIKVTAVDRHGDPAGEPWRLLVVADRDGVRTPTSKRSGRRGRRGSPMPEFGVWIDGEEQALLHLSGSGDAVKAAALVAVDDALRAPTQPAALRIEDGEERTVLVEVALDDGVCTWPTFLEASSFTRMRVVADRTGILRPGKTIAPKTWAAFEAARSQRRES